VEVDVDAVGRGREGGCDLIDRLALVVEVEDRLLERFTDAAGPGGRGSRVRAALALPLEVLGLASENLLVESSAGGGGTAGGFLWHVERLGEEGGGVN